MDRERSAQLANSLEGIRNLLSHLHGEVTALESSYAQVLLVLQKLEGAVTRDDLTGTLRRNAFFKRWQDLLVECEKLNQSSGLILIDIDHFKRINDQHGHPAGDEVLKRIGAILRQFESPHCLIGRYGGEEFVVAIKGTEKETYAMAEFIRKRVESHSNGRSDKLGCTASLGVVTVRGPGAASTATELLEKADRALYEAKGRGRNQVRVA